jgi:hypothetical protein
MHRLRTVVATWIVVLAGSLGHAFEFPPDGEFIVTDDQGVIVAVGRTASGTSAWVEVWSGFEGPAQLTLLLGDGRTRSIDVTIGGGVVTIEGVDLRELLAEVFEDVAVVFLAGPGVGADPTDVAPGGGDASGDGEPPRQDRRPDEPPGQERRPEEPPGHEPGADDPPGAERRPEEPPGHDRRPDANPRAR